MSEAVKRDRLQRKPQIPRRKERKGRISFITDEEEVLITKLLTQLGRDDFLDYFIVLLDTVMRRGEVLRSLIPRTSILKSVEMDKAELLVMGLSPYGRIRQIIRGLSQ
jgi:hypothetical protein